MAPGRGTCITCRYAFRLRRDGTVQEHRLFCGSERAAEPCGGSGQPPYADYCIHVEVDLNVRVKGGQTFYGFEEVRPGMATRARTWDASGPARVGDKVLAIQSDDAICADAQIVGLDRERHLVYLTVDWGGFRDMEAD